MKKISSIAFLSGFLSLALQAQVTPVSYDFNSYANDVNGNWDNLNGWTTTTVGGFFHVTSANSSDGSSYIGFSDSGPGYGATASIANTFGTPTTSDQFYLSFSYYTGNFWGTSAGLGNSASQGLTLTAEQNDANNVSLSLDGTALAASSFDFSGSTWYDFAVDINLGANGGDGSATVFSRQTGTSAWNLVSSLDNIDLNLDSTRTAGDSSNPLNWNTLWFHEEGATSGIDNLDVAPGAVPEPSTWALIGMGILALALHHRRSRRTTTITT